VAEQIRLLPLSGSTFGEPLPLILNATWRTLHTAAATVPGQTTIDRVCIWVANPQVATHTVTIGWGSQATNDRIVNGLSLSGAQVPVQIADGLPLMAGLSIQGISLSATGTAGPNVFGYVIRITT